MSWTMDIYYVPCITKTLCPGQVWLLIKTAGSRRKKKEDYKK
jgi:hypothetical protein